MAIIPKPRVMTAETMAQWQKDVSAHIWEMVRDLQDYGPGLLDMLNTCRAGMNQAPAMADRMYFKGHHDMLRFAIGFAQAAAPIYDVMHNQLAEHVLLDPEGKVIDATPEPQAMEGDEDGPEPDRLQ